MHSFYGVCGMVSALHGARTGTLGFAIKKMPLRVKTETKKGNVAFFCDKIVQTNGSFAFTCFFLFTLTDFFHFFLCMCEGLRGGVGGVALFLSPGCNFNII